MTDERERHTSAIIARSLTWADEDLLRTAHERRLVANESMRWQQISQHGAQAEMWAFPGPFNRGRNRRKYRPPREPNRLVELHGLMGAIGEQLGLAYAAEQDVQRLRSTSGNRDEVHQRLVQRAVAETAVHFLLGAAHSLANLVLRLLLLNSEAASTLNRQHPRADAYPPGSDDRHAWVTLNTRTVRELRVAAGEGSNRFLMEAVNILDDLQTSDTFRDLDSRRGMDYHRRRPQSVPHTSPRTGTVTHQSGTTTISMVAARLEPEADADQVYAMAVDALTVLRRHMNRLRVVMPKAIRAEGIYYEGPR